jgi:hypothetical protein
VIRLKVFISSVQKELELKQAYLDLLRTCHIFLLIIRKEYGQPLADGYSATHQEYRLARQRKLPMPACVKGNAGFERDEKEKAFLEEVRKDGHSYSRSVSLEELLRFSSGRTSPTTSSILCRIDSSSSASRSFCASISSKTESS